MYSIFKWLSIKRRRILCFTLIFVLAFIVWWRPTWYNKPITSKNHATFETFLVLPFNDSQQFAMLPNLSQLRWPVIPVAQVPAGYRFPNGIQQRLPPAFEPVWSSGQRKVSEHLLATFAETMSKHNLGKHYIIYGGTLLGSYRHHDMIPWDDDIDVMVDINVRPKVQTILSQLAPNYILSKQSTRDKFYAAIVNNPQNGDDVEGSLQTSEFNWGWPFVDIGYYLMNDTYVWELALSYGRAYWWPKSVIFPLILRPLGLHWYPTPFRLYRFLKHIYPSMDKCEMNGYSHVFEKNGVSASTSCDKLHGRFAFVERTYDKKNTTSGLVWAKESLVMHNLFKHLIHEIYLPWIAD